jgi:L-lactate dehydrogenase (cytochrome)
MILKYAGKDATEEYEPIHPANALEALPPDAFKGTITPTIAPDTMAPNSTASTVQPVQLPPGPSKQQAQERQPMLHECLSLRDMEVCGLNKQYIGFSCT